MLFRSDVTRKDNSDHNVSRKENSDHNVSRKENSNDDVSRKEIAIRAEMEMSMSIKCGRGNQKTRQMG